MRSPIRHVFFLLILASAIEAQQTTATFYAPSRSIGVPESNDRSLINLLPTRNPGSNLARI